jgi:hypothetical protein
LLKTDILSDYSCNLYRYDLANLEKPEPSAPELVNDQGPFERRSTHSAVIWNDKLIMFGGKERSIYIVTDDVLGWNGRKRKWFNDIYEFDFGKECEYKK